MKKVLFSILLVLLVSNVLAYGGAIGGFIFMPESKDNGNNYLFHQQLDSISDYVYECGDIDRIVWEPGSLDVQNTCTSGDSVRNVDIELSQAMKKGYIDVIMIGQTNPRYMGLSDVHMLIEVKMSGKGDGSLTVRVPGDGFDFYRQKRSFGFFRPKIEWIEMDVYSNGNDYSFDIRNDDVIAVVAQDA
ncbi:MAG: hypothetical protein NDI94_02750 [Candidatus Woesearchaeota archaeon]|nr:hypothetical protein [Candidatus Woesearchaeota archaeon]